MEVVEEDVVDDVVEEVAEVDAVVEGVLCAVDDVVWLVVLFDEPELMAR